jgi:hypothetical protein
MLGISLGSKDSSGRKVSDTHYTDVLRQESCIDDHCSWLTGLPKGGGFKHERHSFGGHRLEEDGTTPSDE